MIDVSIIPFSNNKNSLIIFNMNDLSFMTSNISRSNLTNLFLIIKYERVREYVRE